jgi:hypothetical protein
MAFALVLVAPAIASAKLPFFGLDVRPLRPDVGEPITLTMTCYEDAGHTRPWSSCLGADGPMAWVHPLDDEGRLDRDDWIEVEGYAVDGATRGRITLTEPGTYDILPLWRGWGTDHSPGFPDPVRIEVGGRGGWRLAAGVALGIVATGLIHVGRKRRARLVQPVTVEGSQFAPEARTATRSPGAAA